MTTRTLKLHDVECSSCAMQIEDALERMPGVTRAEVNVRRATVAVEAEDGVTSEAMAATLDGIGFPATPEA